MKVLNVTNSLDLRTGGGTAERTYQMSRALAIAGHACTVLTLDTGLDRERIESALPAKVYVLPCLWDRFYLPRGDWKAIRELVKDADIVHLIGHWSVLNAMVYAAVRLTGKPFVVCPAGALPIFGRSAWIKRAYNFIVGAALVRNASAWIAVTDAELPHFAAYGVPRSQVTVIPNGVNKHDFDDFDLNALHAMGVSDAPAILFMGRLNPIKGPDLLLRAFALVRQQLSGFQLVFAGPDGGMLAQLQAAVPDLGLTGRVHFLGHVDGRVKAAAYRYAQLLVVPSRQEAMSIVALEAGICGTPVLLTDQCGFPAVKTIDPHLEVAVSAEALADGLISVLKDADLLSTISTKWQNYVERQYGWAALIPAYVNLYRRVIAAESSR